MTNSRKTFQIGPTIAAAGHALRVAFRSLARTPGFTGIALVTLALGLGATIALFTVVDRVLLEPLPYPGADRLVTLRHPVPGLGLGEEEEWDLSEAGYFYLRANSRTLAELGVYRAAEVNLAVGGRPERGRIVRASAGLFDVLGAKPLLGRSLAESDERPGAAPVAVLGYDYWQRRYAGDAGVVGSTIQVDGRTTEIVGIARPGMHLPDQPTDVWLPAQLDPAARPINSHYLSAIARLAPGVTLDAAQADMNNLTARFTEAMPSAYSTSFVERAHFATRVRSLRVDLVGDVARALWISLASVGLVLLIACANVANLFLVRGEARRREVAVRSALGASRSNLARLFIAESLTLAVVAGALGLAMASFAVRALVAASPPGIPRIGEIGIGAHAMLFAAVLSVGAGVVFGLLPLVRVRRSSVTAELREGGRGLAGSARGGLRQGLVVAQFAMAVVLLTAAALMLQSFRALRAVDPGFDAAGVLTFDITLPFTTYGDAGAVALFYRRLTERLEALPGIESAGGAVSLPLKSESRCFPLYAMRPTGVEPASGACVGTNFVAPGYFEALGIPVRGRPLEWRDVDAGLDPVVLSRSLAARLWPGGDAIGQAVDLSGDPEGPHYRVVGIAEDVHSDGLDRAAPEMVYYALVPREGQSLPLPRFMTFAVRARTGAPVALTDAVRNTLAALDPEIPIGNVQTMRAIVDHSMTRVSFTMLLLGIAAVVALVLGSVGLYGVVSYVVGRRRPEIGVRMALGARSTQVGTLVLRQSLGLALAGVALGIAAALAATRLLRSLLFEVSPNDPRILGAVSLLLVGVAALAAYLPARRAAAIDPVEALRLE